MTDLLRRALVGADHVDQYRTDAEFHATVDQLALMLPVWVDGLAMRCAETAGERAALAAAMERQPWPS